MNNIVTQRLDLTPKKKARLGKYDQETLDALLAKPIPEEMTPAMEEAVKKYEEKQRETTEKKEKSLEFEDHTFKIDSTGWKEEERNMDPREKIKVKINPTGDVVEYLEWPAKGEQLFIGYDTFIRELCKAKNCSQEEAEKKYLMTEDEFKEKMKDKPSDSEEYKKFFDKEVEWRLAGYWSSHHKEFYNFLKSVIWLAGGHGVSFHKTTWSSNSVYAKFGFSGRLLKN